MGSIASVLQWHCEECSLINPTERLNCVRCGFSRDGENTGWKHHHGVVKQNSCIRGAKNNSSHNVSPPSAVQKRPGAFLEEDATSTKGRCNDKKYFTWGPSSSPCRDPAPSLNRSASICTITRHWCCVRCKFSNGTVCSSCVGCGYILEKDYQKTTFKKENLSIVTMDSYSPNWFSDEASRSHSPVKNSDTMTPVETPINLNSVIDRNNSSSQTLNRSPKRQSPSMYERVKSKVSRSLSNGSVVQKLWLENSSKSVLFKRPTSLLVDTNSSPADVNKNTKEESDLTALYAVVNKNRKKPPVVIIETWTCPRCTLENSIHFDHCDVCETPRKASMSQNTLPRNGVVITVPEWDSTDVDSSKPTTIYKSIKIVGNNSKPSAQCRKSSKANSSVPVTQETSQTCYSKPVYRRCYSEVNTPNPESSSQNKILANRRSMIETDVQNNLLLKSPVSNLNAHKSVGLRYSYIGITEPASKSCETKELSFNEYRDNCSKTSSDLKQTGSLRKRTLPIPPMDLPVTSSRELPNIPSSTISYSVSSPYHQNSTSQKSSTQSSLNTTPDSIPEITVINSVTESNVKNSRVSPYDRMWQSTENGIEVINRSDARSSYDCMWQSTNEAAETNNSKNTSRMSPYDRLWSNSLEQNSDNQSSNKTSRVSHYDRMWQSNSSTPDSLPETSSALNSENSFKNPKLNQFDRMWTCIKCSYAYNPIWSDCCDICNSVRSPPSLTEPSLITVTKDSVRYTPPKDTSGYIKNVNQKNKIANDLNLNWSLALGPATLATLEQDLEEDFQFLPGADNVANDSEGVTEEWTCKKCTLVSVLVSSF